MPAFNEYESDKTSLRTVIVMRHPMLMSMVSMKSDSIQQSTSWGIAYIEWFYEPHGTF
jgi:hypothetical protein